MIITWQGQSCFKIQDKAGSDGITVTTDPFDKTLGLKVPNFESDIVTISHDHFDHNNAKALRGDPFVVNSAGEFDIKGVMVEGIKSYHDDKKGAERGDNIIFRIEMDGITVTHLGDLGHTLESEHLDRLEGTDILLIPVGGNYTIDPKKAAEIVNQIEPRIVIPMHYKVKGLKTDVCKVGNEEAFIKELGIDPTKEDKLKISKRDLPQEETELIILDINK